MHRSGTFALRYRAPARVLAVGFLIFAVAITFSQDLGPISTRNHRAISLPFLRFEPRSNLLSHGEREWNLSWTTANDFRMLAEGSRLTEEDYEIQRFALHYRERLRNDLEWSIEIPWLSRGAGFQDPIIDWWHANVLHWSDPLRNSRPFGKTYIRLPNESFEDSADGLGDISVVLSHALGKRWIGSVGLKLPTGNPSALLGSGAIDAGIYVQGRVPIYRKLTLHGQLGIIFQGEAKKLSNSRDLVHQEGLSLVWQQNSRDAWVAQWQGEASAIRSDVSGSDSTHRLLTFGYKRRLSTSQQLDVFFSEDRDVFSGNFPEGANIGPDFTMGIRLGFRF